MGKKKKKKAGCREQRGTWGDMQTRKKMGKKKKKKAGCREQTGTWGDTDSP
jgi:hypothetical protein